MNGIHTLSAPASLRKTPLTRWLLLTLFGWFLAGHTALAAELVPITSTYKAVLEKGIPFDGKATRSLKASGQKGVWEYRFLVESYIADIDEVLLLRWENDRVIPLRYEYNLSGWAIKNRRIVQTFDWAAHKVHVDNRGKISEMEIPDGALDKLGFQLQLMQDLKAGKKEVAYTLIDKTKIKTYEFKVIGQEKLQTEQGKIDTILVEKVRAPSKDRETHMWFVPAWEYLLVKLVQVEDGTRYEINMDKASLPNRVID